MPLLFALESADGGGPRCSYHRTASGLWVELVRAAFADHLTEWVGASRRDAGGSGAADTPAPSGS